MRKLGTRIRGIAGIKGVERYQVPGLHYAGMVAVHYLI